MTPELIEHVRLWMVEEPDKIPGFVEELLVRVLEGSQSELAAHRERAEQAEARIAALKETIRDLVSLAEALTEVGDLCTAIVDKRLDAASALLAAGDAK